MKICIDITNCSDKKSLVYGLSEAGYPVAFVETEPRLAQRNVKIIVEIPDD